MGRCVQRPVMVLESCELAWHARFRGPDGLRRGLTGSIAVSVAGSIAGSIAGSGAKSFIGAKIDLKNGKFVLGQGKKNLFLV